MYETKNKMKVITDNMKNGMRNWNVQFLKINEAKF